MSLIRVVNWENGACHLLDQTRLPVQEAFLKCTGHLDVVAAIRVLLVRGAPAIGVAAAYGATLAAQEALQLPLADRRQFLSQALTALAQARPTAVNLGWAIQRMNRAWSAIENECTEVTVARFLEEARAIEAFEISANEKISSFGADVIPPGDVITHCNAGTLATVGMGTALGIIRECHRRGTLGRVYPCETRPLLQGLRLTTWELAHSGIPFTVVCDSMSAWLMQQKKPSAVIVGADRIVGNGDAANKIGTYALAVLARHHGIPFFVAAPVSTFDLSLDSGADIPIEERNSAEIFSVLGGGEIPYMASAWNPAFDVTPNDLISAIISERGVMRSPYRDTLRDVIGS